jgi:hypothetical protein
VAPVLQFCEPSIVRYTLPICHRWGFATLALFYFINYTFEQNNNNLASPSYFLSLDFKKYSHSDSHIPLNTVA